MKRKLGGPGEGGEKEALEDEDEEGERLPAKGNRILMMSFGRGPKIDGGEEEAVVSLRRDRSRAEEAGERWGLRVRRERQSWRRSKVPGRLGPLAAPEEPFWGRGRG